MKLSERVVLGHPFEGAFYWLMSAEDWRKSSIRSPCEGNHPYYKTLYGKQPHRLIDATASLALLYDRILLAPADCPLPDWQSHTTGSKYEHKELGLLSDWNWVPKGDEFDDHLHMIMADIEKHHILDKVPQRVRTQIIRGVLTQLSIAHEFNADVMGNERYLRLCRRIQDITGEYANAGVPSSIEQLPRSLKTAFSISALQFELHGLKDFVALRSDKYVLKYEKAFRNQIAKLPNEGETANELLKAMLDALESNELSDKISGGLKTAAQACTYASLVPIIGTGTGLVGMGVGHTAKGVDVLSERDQWWLLAPRISEVITRSRLKQIQLNDGKK